MTTATLTPKERRVLDAIKSEGGEHCVNHLADYAGVPYGGIAIVCRNLERKGLVRYGEWWDEDRGHKVYLTETGSDIYDDDPPVPSPFEDARGQDGIDPGSGDSA